MKGKQMKKTTSKNVCAKSSRKGATCNCKSVKDAKPMTLDFAIEHAEETAKRKAGTECGSQHQQLADWLKELREYRKMYPNAVKIASKKKVKIPAKLMRTIEKECANAIRFDGRNVVAKDGTVIA